MSLLTNYIQETQREQRRRRRDPWVLLFLGGILISLALRFPEIAPLFLIFFVLYLGYSKRHKSVIAPTWVNQSRVILKALKNASNESLPELFALGEALESLPKLNKRLSRKDPNAHRANRLVFDVQEALFVTLTRLLAYNTPQELGQLTESQRSFLRRVIFRTADASLIACALLVLATLKDTALRSHTQELAEHHPSERIREAAKEYLLSLTPP